MKPKIKNIKSGLFQYIHSALSLLIVISFSFHQTAIAEEINTGKTEDLTQEQLILKATLTPPYIIGPGDELTIVDRTLREVFGQNEIYNVIVSSDGYISIPLPDGKQENIQAAGSTLDELSEEIRKEFSKTLINPLVYIQITKYRPINIYLGGEVVKPGVYKIETGSTTEKGGQTTGLSILGLSLTQAIQIAGGLKPRADITAIAVTRGAQLEKRIINLLALIRDIDISQDINLQPGDTIFVPPAEDYEKQAQNHVKLLGKLAYQEVNVNVVGEVGVGGNFTLPNDATLLDALGKAGGISQIGNLKRISLARYDEDGTYKEQTINIDDFLKQGSKFDQIALRPNDTIKVEVSKAKAAGRFFRDTGKILIPLVTSATVSSFGTFVVQDNFFNRITRAGSSNSLKLPSTGGNGITIIGGERIFNENK